MLKTCLLKLTRKEIVMSCLMKLLNIDAMAIKSRCRMHSPVTHEVYIDVAPLKRAGKILVKWKDGSTTWIALKDTKESYPVQLEEYDVQNRISLEPAFTWWAPYVLRKRNFILARQTVTTVTPCSNKITLHPALHSVLTARRLFVTLGNLWAVCAVGGSLSRRRSSVSVVFMVDPLGMERDFAIS